MNEQQQQQPGEDGRLHYGDDGFIGVNQRLDPALVPAGYCSDARNFQFEDGVAKPRKGFVPQAWTNRLGATWPWVWPVFWDTVVPFGSIQGAATFSDPNGDEWTIIAADGRVYRTRQGTNAREIPLPSGVYLTAGVEFVQCFDVLVMFRGANAAALVMRDFSSGFVDVTMEANTISGPGTQNPTDGTQPIPNGVNGIMFSNRLLVVHGRDLVAVSDVLNYTRYAPQLADFRITQGTADRLKVLYKFNDATILCFKDHSIVYVTNVEGDLSNITQVPLTTEYGCIAPKSVVGVGEDVWFLSEKGIASIKQTDNNKVQSTAGQVSDPVLPTMRRINWLYAEGAVAAVHEGKVYFALPLDSASKTLPNGTVITGVNNAILVYDLVNQAWAGVWDGSGVTVKHFLKFQCNGKRVLGFVSSDGYLVAMNQTLDDVVQGEITVIEALLTSRGYGRSEGGQLHYRDVELDVSTHAPHYQVELVTDGVSETADVADVTRSKTRYYMPSTRQAWDASNVDFDFLEPHREDYAVDLMANIITADNHRITADNHVVTADGAGWYADAPGMQIGYGIILEQHQRAKTRYRVNQQARYMQVRVDQNSGRVQVHGIKVAATIGRRTRGVLS
jgi:hypothetical protein